MYTGVHYEFGIFCMTFSKVKTYVLFFYTAFVVLFFLPAVQDIFSTAKWYLTGAVALVLLALSTLEFILTKKVRFQRRDTDGSVFLFILAVSLSVMLVSTNKIEALLIAPFSLLTFVFLSVIYYYLARTNERNNSLFFLLIGVGVLIAAASIFQFIPVFARVLPKQLAAYTYITPAGRPIETLVYLAFAGVVSLGLLFETKHKNAQLAALVASSAVVCIAAGVVAFTLISSRVNLILAPFSTSWYAVLETMKHPISALFGVGVGNFQSLFLVVKDATYNSSPLWQIATYEQSRSVIFHIASETGLVGVVSFGLLMAVVLKESFNERARLVDKMIAVFFLGSIWIVPPTFLYFVLFFIWLGFVASRQNTKEITLDLHEMLPVYVGGVLLMLVSIAVSSFFLFRFYMAEKTYQDALRTTNLKNAYDLTRTSLGYNPSNERVHSSLAQINMLIANTVAGNNPSKMSESDKQTVSQAIQAAIDESKAVVTLNPNRAANWELLGNVYRSIMGVVQGADAWTISAYQRAVVLDPQNPMYRVTLGGVLYGQKQYEDASRLFETAVSLKPDWANAQYNYAWALEQKGDYQKAAAAMQNCVSLLSPTQNAKDHKKATADLEEFKKKIPADTTESDKTTSKQGSDKETLALPKESVSVTPQITLPAGTQPSTK